MTARKLEKTEWRRFFDWVSKGLVGKRAEIEIASLALGDQIEAEMVASAGHHLRSEERHSRNRS